MLNEWFFKWHQIGYQNSVEIDSFDGRNITYGGISFWGTPRNVYWHTLSRYLRKKIDECFNELEQLLATYPNSTARDAIDDAERELNTFIDQIGNDAIEKDRVLQGDGLKFPARDIDRLQKLMSANDVAERAASLRNHLHAVQQSLHTPPIISNGEQVLILRPTIWGISLDLKLFWKRLITYLTGPTL